MATTNVLSLLKQDHKEVKALLEMIAKSSEKALKKREKNFSNLKNMLKLHEKFEQEIFYPRIKENAANKTTKSLVFEAYEEHHVVDILLDELDQLSPSQPEWTAKLVVLKESVKHHIKEEENELFPKVKKIIDLEELKEMGEQFVERKESKGDGASKKEAQTDEGEAL